jgi:RHS repeat-associated protein
MDSILPHRDGASTRPGAVHFDHATSITTTGTGASTITETLAPDGRVLRRTVTGANAEDTDYGYNDNGDSPAWSRPHAGGTVTTYLDNLIVTGTTPAYELANDHGDIVGTVDAAGTLTPYPVADEFGIAAPTANRLGWLGAKERFTVAPTLGVLRMGVRLYDSNLGRFLEPDPNEGGSANNYDYVEADPINGLDLAGTCSWWSGYCHARHAASWARKQVRRAARWGWKKLKHYNPNPWWGPGAVAIAHRRLIQSFAWKALGWAGTAARWTIRGAASATTWVVRRFVTFPIVPFDYIRRNVNYRHRYTA